MSPRLARPTREAVATPSKGELGLQLLEHRVRIRATDGRLVEQLARCFEPAAVVSGDAPDLTVRLETLAEIDVWQAEPPLMRIHTDPLGALGNALPTTLLSLVWLYRRLVQWAVDEAREHYLFHAGALVSKAGVGVLLPASSRRGKSTLTAGLALRGFAVCSDEVGVIDFETGKLHGFPRAFSIRRDVLSVLGLDDTVGWGTPREGARMVRAHELGVRRATTPATLGLIVFPEYRAEIETSIERVGAGDTLAGLMEAACSQKTFKVRGLDFLIALAEGVPCFHLRFSEIASALDAIEGVLVEPGAARR